MEKTFVFNRYDVGENGEVTFDYTVKSNDQAIDFTEKFTFPKADFSQIPEPLRHRLLMNLLLVLGISYWKLYCPKKIEVENNQLTEEQAEFWNRVYTKGLGEFFYKNQIDFRGLVQFPYKRGINAEPVAFERKDRSLLMLGGGKDSIVAGELLRENKKEFTAFVVNDYPIQKEITKLLNIDSITIKREVDQKLLKRNKQSLPFSGEKRKQQEAYNGHVPISAIYAFVGVLAAALYDYNSIITSNEKSANYGNVEYLRETVNHQWSKSFEFEKMFQDYVEKYITSNISYFSLLRPLHEIKIAQLFAKYPKYFSSFSSCNRNFRIQRFTSEESSSNTSEVAERTPRMVGRWCGQCPKCAFIFATLSAFLSKEKMVKIFGKNLFEDISLVNTYKELLGIKNIKPFECVGMPDEVKLALYRTYKKGEYKSDVMMQMFEREVLPTMTNIEKLEKELFAFGAHRIPEAFQGGL